MEKLLVAKYKKIIYESPFVDEMANKLADNDSKGDDWICNDTKFWQSKLLEEFLEIIDNMNVAEYYFDELPIKKLNELVNECADLANVCMMIADNARHYFYLKSHELLK